MTLNEINFINFRNLKDLNIKFQPNFNLFIGKNGQGKTSILEAIYFTITGKSFRTNKINDVIKYGEKICGSYLAYSDTNGEKSTSIKFSENKKIYNFNKNKVSFDEFYGKISVVIFIPEEIELITGNPNFRRKFFDEEISQTNKQYFFYLKEYNKLLKIRNHYLKEKKTSDSLYEIYTDKYIETASKIIELRIKYIKNISIIINLNYRKIFDDTKELSLVYNSNLNYDKKDELEDIKRKIKNEIKNQKENEKRYGYSLIGPQRDEFKFLLNGKEAKSFSSQGEKKSIIFSLKLSQIDMIYKEKKENPIFVIDDISSYFDLNRKESILKYLAKKKVQLFISSTEELNVESKKFYIENGEINDDRT
ncbi:MAG: DNA replication/repair protein RecF [Fusobacteriaceae bacterium]